MKKLTLILLLVFTTISTNNIFAVVDPVTPTEPTIEAVNMEEFGANSLDEFLALTPKKIRKQTGKRLKLKEIVVLKAAQKKVKKALKAGGEDAGSSKSQVIALILVLVAGAIGIHRFYLGYTGIGIAQIFTFGGCGIWALIDLIRIITGDLGPKDGSKYDPTL